MQCNLCNAVACAPRRDAAIDTKDDVLLVGTNQITSFDILDEVSGHTACWANQIENAVCVNSLYQTQGDTPL